MRRSHRAGLWGLIRWRRNVICPICLAALIVLPGCDALRPKLVAPQLSVTGVTFQGGDLQHERLQLNVHVVNPNERSIAVRSIDARLDLAGMPFATGVSDAAFTLPPLGATNFVLDVSADMGGAVGLLASALGHHLIDYRIYGQVHLAHTLIRTVNFAHSGRVRF